uniref:Rac/Cdc42 guanine nucleotide exchange factor 6 n=1 Tax=Scleropages formosus TaxID=113540 RepID=A0A8C9RQQ7_SCLFO
MNPEEQTVTWLISLGVLSSPKKNIADPEEFLKSALRDGVVLCRLLERLQPGSVHKWCAEPRSEAECVANIREFLRGCASLKVEGFEPEDLYTGENFKQVLSTLLAVNFATQARKMPLRSILFFWVAKASSRLDHAHFREMSENGSGGQLVVKARFNFKQNNEDELSFSKGELICVTRQEEGGWWEGTLNGKTGWFPSNYVREVKHSEKPVSPKTARGFDSPQLTKNYYGVVVQDILEHEREFVKDLQTLLGCYLRPLQSSDKLSSADSASLLGNLEDVFTFQQGLCLALEECAKVTEGQQRLGGCYMNLMCQIKTLYLNYCSSHPSAVCVLTDHSEELDRFMESQGASSPGILTLTSSLSKPFVRLDKYPALLQELERHMEEAHPDYSDILKATVAFRNLVAQCQELRKRKNLELQILSEPVRGWEGENMRTLGPVLYMSHVSMQSSASEDKEERYLMLFPNLLIILSASPRMSGFIYQVRPTGGVTVIVKAGHLKGGIAERIMVVCSSQQEHQNWLEQLLPLSKGGSPVGTVSKTASLGFSSPVASRGPLEPPKIAKPWSLSCLRPAPPLKPSAALGYKEVGGDSGRSPRPITKFLQKRKTERKPSDDEFLLRKSTAALEEDAQILKVIEAYCTGGGIFSSGARKECIPQVLLPEEEKIIVEEIRSNGQMTVEEKSLVDAVYALKDEVHELKKENKRMKQCLEEEQKSRKELERIVRKLTTHFSVLYLLRKSFLTADI